MTFWRFNLHAFVPPGHVRLQVSSGATVCVAPQCQQSTSNSLLFTNFSSTRRKPKCNPLADIAPFSGLSSFKLFSDSCSWSNGSGSPASSRDSDITPTTTKRAFYISRIPQMSTALIAGVFLCTRCTQSKMCKLVRKREKDKRKESGTTRGMCVCESGGGGGEVNPLRANYCHTWHMENHPFIWRRIRRIRRIQVFMARKGLNLCSANWCFSLSLKVRVLWMDWISLERLFQSSDVWKKNYEHSGRCVWVVGLPGIVYVGFV